MAQETTSTGKTEKNIFNSKTNNELCQQNYFVLKVTKKYLCKDCQNRGV